MPWSADEGKDFARKQIKALQPSAVLDVGAGAGYYGRFIKKILPKTFVDALEIWEPYIDRFNLAQIYDTVYVDDVRSFTPTQTYDLIIFGDVLEHLEQAEAVQVMSSVKPFARRILVSLPIIEWHQGECEGNPHEAHLHHWTHDDIEKHFEPAASWTGDHIGVYIIKGGAE